MKGINYYNNYFVSAANLLTFLIILTIFGSHFSWLCLLLTFPNQLVIKIMLHLLYKKLTFIP